MIRKIATALATLGLAVGAAIGAAQPAAAFDVRCRETLYGDGAKQARVCFEYYLSSGGTWTLTKATVWNIPLSQGGHTDCICPYIRFFNGAFEDSQQAAVDGGTYTTYAGFTAGPTSQSNTIWLDYKAFYNNVSYCKRVFVNSGGGTSATNITCPS